MYEFDRWHKSRVNMPRVNKAAVLAFGFVWVVGSAISLTIVGIVIYVILHFVSKFW